MFTCIILIQCFPNISFPALDSQTFPKSLELWLLPQDIQNKCHSPQNNSFAVLNF